MSLLDSTASYFVLLLQDNSLFPNDSDAKESAYSVEDPGSVPGLGRSSGEGNALPAPVFLPREFHGQRSLAGYNPWDRKESDTTE